MTATQPATTTGVWACPDGQLVLPADRTYTAEWYAMRQTGIGASDLAALYHQSSWTTAYQLWLDKVEGRDWTEESEAMRWGKVLEDPIATEWAHRFGMQIRNVGTYRSKTHPHALANPDRLTSDGGGLEVKTADKFARGWYDDMGNPAIPVAYELQAEACLAVTGRTHWWVVCLKGGRDLLVRRVERDEQRMAGHLDAIEMWWKHHVDRLNPPEHGRPVPIEAIQTGVAREATLPDSVLHDVARWKAILAGEAANEEELAAIKERLEMQIGTAEILTVDRRPVLKRVQRKAARKFDRKRFARDHPDLEAQYVDMGDPIQYLSLYGGNDE